MKRQETNQSSFIQEVLYHSTVLTVKFKGGAVYQYPNVPKWVYDELAMADSVGSFFHRHVKNQFEAVKLTA